MSNGRLGLGIPTALAAPAHLASANTSILTTARQATPPQLPPGAVYENPAAACPAAMHCAPGTVLILPPKEYSNLRAKGMLSNRIAVASAISAGGVGSCAALATLGKRSSNSGNVQGFTTCTVAVIYIEQEVSGQHCTIYLFGGCDFWQPGVWYAPEYPCETTGTYAYEATCPSNGGEFIWGSIPHPWLVRSNDYSCADFLNEGLACGDSASYQVQF